MDKQFGNPYRGDPGVPHTDPGSFIGIWIGSFTFSAVTCLTPFIRGLPNKLNWHDKAMMLEQMHWKKIMEKQQQLPHQWDQMCKSIQEKYYSWPVYFP